ncbi:MAG TPA: LLM class F420-dependent oxidoreductase [Chloroflexota bacterium]|nr:LLM class F420-dependent oxidoreductase [Chloroflexota bacterium]
MGTDPVAMRDFAQAVEQMGLTHLLAYEHVIGANIDRPDRAGQRWPYNHRSTFHEPFVLFGYLAAVTQRLEFVTGVIVLPQRQTVLVAKQAAALDVLSGGRLRLGVGIGWNAVEYEALREEFHNRGRRFDEQIEVMRTLWTEELVTYRGRWHQITDAGINPLPVQRPIPLWIGGAQAPQTDERMLERVLRRIGRVADGWMLTGRASNETARRMDRIREYARQAGRDPSSIGLEGAIPYGEGNPDTWRQDLAAWQRIGATHITLQTRGAGIHSPHDHIAALQRMRDEVASSE